MHKESQSDRSVVEGRFATVFGHLDFIVAYARRRGARDPDGIAAEVMAIAWRRLADVPTDDPRPWLIGTTRNLLLAEHRREPLARTQTLGDIELEAPADLLPSEWDLDPELAGGLRALSDTDREALLLIAWDDLTPSSAAKSLGISPAAFRVRLHRARRRLSDRLTKQAPVSRVSTHQSNVSTQPIWRPKMNDDRLMRRLRAARPKADEHGDHGVLFARIVAEPGDPRLTETASPVVAWRRPRVLAGSTLGLAGVSAALVLALGGTAATAPAFAVTREADGSVLVTVNTDQTMQPWAEGADKQLAAKGINEAIDGIEIAPGPATSSAPVKCKAGFGAAEAVAGGGYRPVLVGTPSGPPVEVVLGTAGTDTVPAGTTGAGTVHLVSCDYHNAPAGAGNSGPGS